MLGLRKGEVSGLQWTDLNWEKAELKISQQVQVVNGKTVFTTPKSDTSRRTLPIPPLLLKRLQQHWDNQQEERALLDTEWKEHGLIFPTQVGTPIIPRNLCLQIGYTGYATTDARASITYRSVKSMYSSCSGV